jgi:hypothetical protein
LITNLFISEISVEQAEYVHLSAVKYQNTANAKKHDGKCTHWEQWARNEGEVTENLATRRHFQDACLGHR